jgi:hypothetical protein
MQKQILGVPTILFLSLMTIQNIPIVYHFFFKSKAFVIFQTYKALVEKQNDKIIKVLCNNNGGSILPLHLNHFVLFKVYCANLQYHTHLNKMVLLNKKTKPLSKLHKVCFTHPITRSFWVEAIYISCYIQN